MTTLFFPFPLSNGSVYCHYVLCPQYAGCFGCVKGTYIHLDWMRIKYGVRCCDWLTYLWVLRWRWVYFDCGVYVNNWDQLGRWQQIKLLVPILHSLVALEIHTLATTMTSRRVDALSWPWLWTVPCDLVEKIWMETWNMLALLDFYSWLQCRTFPNLGPRMAYREQNVHSGICWF